MMVKQIKHIRNLLGLLSDVCVRWPLMVLLSVLDDILSRLHDREVSP